LILQWLLSRLLRRTGEGLLNLKDLLTAFSPRLKGLFENEPVWRRCFGYQIVPNLTIFDQKRAANELEHGTKRGFSRPTYFPSGGEDTPLQPTDCPICDRPLELLLPKGL